MLPKEKKKRRRRKKKIKKDFSCEGTCLTNFKFLKRKRIVLKWAFFVCVLMSPTLTSWIKFLAANEGFGRWQTVRRMEAACESRLKVVRLQGA